MFNNSSHVDASHSTFSEVHHDQFFNVRSTVQGNQTVNTIIHGNQIVQDSQTNLIDALRKVSAASAAHDSAQRYPAPKCIEGTRIELLARLSSWVDEPDEKPICWLNGRPGSGKSAVSQTIAEKYASEGRLAASFFFSRRDLERRSTQHVVPTLITQLLIFLPSIRPTVISALEKDFRVPMKVLREQVEKLLLEPLSTATETPDKHILIVLDALDECDDEKLVSELVALVALLPRKTSLPLRLFITSRSDPWIQSRFHRPEISSLTLSLDIHAFSAEADIRSFLRGALDNTYDEHLQVMESTPRPWPSPDDLERIVNKASGLFIFALTVIKFVGERTHNPLLRLQAVLEDTTAVSTGSAYADLDSLYRDAISVFPDPDVARLVLGVVYCMTTPISVSGLHKLLQRPDVDVRLVVPALSSVLLVSEDGKQLIQFYHASFRDFLVDPQRSRKYTINPDAYHRLMAQLCFEMMSNSLKRDICGIGDPSKANSEVPELSERVHAVFHEALMYACRFWSRHLAQLPSDGVANEMLLSSLKKFSTTVLLCWIEALSLFGELESAVIMLRQGTSWLKTLRDAPADTIILFQQAERLVVLYMDPISQCALHVYITAILLVPENKGIYETFKHLSYGTIITRPPIDDYFDVLRRAVNVRDPIYSVVFSPNADLIATAGVKQGVQLWNTITGGNIASFGDRASTSLLVSFSPSGTFLAGVFEGGTVIVWDPKVGREHLKHERCHTEPITCIDFSPNSAFLASGSRDHMIQVWSMESAQALYQLATHEGPVTSLAFSTDSRRLFSGSEDHLVIIWDMSSGKVVRGMMGHRKTVNCVAVSKDGRFVVSGSDDKMAKIWDLSTGKCTRTFSKGHGSGVRSVRFFDEDKYLVVTCDQAIISWDISRNKSDTIWASEQMLRVAMRVVPLWQANVLGWSIPKSLWRYLLNHDKDSQDSHMTIAIALQSSSFVFLHNGFVYSGSLPIPVNRPPIRDTATVTGISVSYDGLWAATADPHGSLEILDLTAQRRSWEEVAVRARSDLLDNILSLVPSPNGKRFLVNALYKWCLTDENYCVMKKIDTGILGPMRGNESVRFKFSGDGSIFLCALSSPIRDDKSTVRVYDAVTGEQHTKFKELQSIHSFVASTDGAWIACCHGSVKVEVLGVAVKSRTSMRMHDDTPVNVLMFSDSAQSLVGGSEKGVVYVWDRASGECTAMFTGPTTKITALAYAITDTPNQARVAIGREDGSLSVWCPPSSASHDILRADQATVKNVDFVRFSDDRLSLMSSGEDGTAFTWAVPGLDDENMTQCELCPPSREGDEEGDGTKGDSEGNGEGTGGDEGVGADARDGNTHDGDHNQPGSGTAPNNQTTAPPHLLSRSDPDDIVDASSRSAYRIRKDGWLVEGERRVIWIPQAIRPHGKDTFYAFGNGSVALYTPSSLWLFLKCEEAVN